MGMAAMLIIRPNSFVLGVVGWCDGAGLTSSIGASYNLDNSGARAYCARSRGGWRLFGHFYSHLSILSSFSLSLGDDPIQTEILSQRAVNPKTTDQPKFDLGVKWVKVNPGSLFEHSW